MLPITVCFNFINFFFSDEKLLSYYKITDGEKLFLFQKKKQMTPTPDSSSVLSTNASWEKLEEFLRRHFTPQDAEKVSIEFKKV